MGLTVIDLSGWSTLVIALTAFVPATVAAIISFLAFMESRHNARRLNSAATAGEKTAIAVTQVHEIVNSQRTAMEARIKELTDRMEKLYKVLGARDEEIAARKKHQVG